MRYNSESLEIKVVISGDVLLLKDIKISLEFFLLPHEKSTLYVEKITTSTCQRL